jgi:hypothetical protein
MFLWMISSTPRADANVCIVHNEVSNIFPARAPYADFRSVPAQVTHTVAVNVKLSRKYSVSLTDITTFSQDPNVSPFLGICNKNSIRYSYVSYFV